MQILTHRAWFSGSSLLQGAEVFVINLNTGWFCWRWLVSESKWHFQTWKYAVRSRNVVQEMNWYRKRRESYFVSVSYRERCVIDGLSLYSFFLSECLSICLFRATPVAYGSSQLGAELELQLPSYTTATAMPDPSHNLQQCWILNPLSKARDQTRILMDSN